MTTDLALASATELVGLYRQKKASPVEVTEAVLARIEAHNPTYNAFCLVDAEAARAAARESEARWAASAANGLVDGVPATVKDLILTRGWPTRRGSKTVPADQPWEDDAPAVARLREHGAVLLGKTATPEYGWKGVTDSPLTGITRNPWNPERTPGGSSGGAAVAAVMGMGALHLGTDGGGSIRIPSAFTGNYGIKATFGRVPAWPASPHGSLANVGPMTRTVADAALMLTVISEPDPRDWLALPPARADYREALVGGIDGLKIAFAPAPGGAKVAPEVAELVAEGARVFEELGAKVEPADPPIAEAAEIFRTHWFAVAAQLVKGIDESDRKLMDPGLLAIAEQGAKIPLDDFVAALAGRRALGFAMHRFLQEYDLLLTPMLPLPAFEVGHAAPPGMGESGWVDWTPFSYPFNLTRQPAASLPLGPTASGLPAALQLVGPLHAEALVLRASRAFEQVRPWPLPPAATAKAS